MSDVAKDDPVRRALVSQIVGTTEEFPETIGEPGYRALGMVPRCAFTRRSGVHRRSSVSHARSIWTRAPIGRVSVLVDSFPGAGCNDIPCFVVTEGERFLIDMRPVD